MGGKGRQLGIVAPIYIIAPDITSRLTPGTGLPPIVPFA